MQSFWRRILAECLGSFLLFATVIGSGIMAETLSQGNDAVALLGNTIATGAMLFVLITIFGPISGAHFNPAVTIIFWLRREFAGRDIAPFFAAQLAGGLVAIVAVHFMFDLPIWQISAKTRIGGGQYLGEGIATFGLILTIFGTLRHKAESVPTAVALFITAGYWFTSSTSFANPAITIIRSMTDSFAGIAPTDAPAFIVAQLIGAVAAWKVSAVLFPNEQ